MDIDQYKVVAERKQVVMDFTGNYSCTLILHIWPFKKLKHPEDLLIFEVAAFRKKYPTTSLPLDQLKKSFFI